MTKITMPETAGAEAIGQLIGRTGRQVRNLLSELGIKPAARGAYPLSATVSALFELERSRAEGKSKQAGEVGRLRARKLDLEIAELEGKVLPIETVEATFDLIIGRVQSCFAGLPARVTRDPASKRRLDEEIRRVQNELADDFATFNDAKAVQENRLKRRRS